MLTAKAKRKENIAEYILYLWQLEDLLRALDLNESRIKTTLTDPLTLDEGQKQMLLFWYIDMVNLLKSEGKSERGHLDHTLHLIGELYDMHLALLSSQAGASYVPLFLELAPHLETLRKRLDNDKCNDIELCFRALYGVMLQRMKSPSQYDKDVLELISPVVATLSHLFLKVERGEVDIYKGSGGEKSE